tara:strand:- start:198 stop:647 length:450 start_codon:yes stop_codon:yes gene_type:complete
MDRNKTKKAMQDAMKKLGNPPKRRKALGMSPGQRKAMTGSATGKTPREKLMEAFKKAKSKRKAPMAGTAKQMQSRGMTPAQARNQARRKSGPAGMSGIVGAMPGTASAVNRAAMSLAKKIAGDKRPTNADIKSATAMLKRAMRAAGKGK